MAPVNTMKGTQLRIMIESDDTPGVFVHPCLINTTRGIQWTSTGNDEEIPDCDDPDAMAWTKHTKTGASGTISGAGKLNVDDVEIFWDWFDSDIGKNVKIDVGNTGVWDGVWKLTDFNITGDRGSVAEATVTMKSHGVQVYTAGASPI